jgi:uncharacterized membrane protein required for colicin V production
MNSLNLPIGIFDLILVGFLTIGVLRGRKQGMSEELLSLMKWLTLVFICAAAYEPLGRIFVSNTTVFSSLSCYLMAYVAAALLVLASFAGLKRALGGKLLGSDIFGSAEYYLGMGSGLVRFGCILVAVLALLNAREYDPAEVRAMENFQNREFGSNYFPTLHTIQAMVFENSLTGPWIKGTLSFLLIKPTKPESREFKQKEYQFPQ